MQDIVHDAHSFATQITAKGACRYTNTTRNPPHRASPPQDSIRNGFRDPTNGDSHGSIRTDSWEPICRGATLVAPCREHSRCREGRPRPAPTEVIGERKNGGDGGRMRPRTRRRASPMLGRPGQRCQLQMHLRKDPTTTDRSTATPALIQPRRGQHHQDTVTLHFTL